MKSSIMVPIEVSYSDIQYLADSAIEQMLENYSTEVEELAALDRAAIKDHLLENTNWEPLIQHSLSTFLDDGTFVGDVVQALLDGELYQYLQKLEVAEQELESEYQAELAQRQAQYEAERVEYYKQQLEKMGYRVEPAVPSEG